MAVVSTVVQLVVFISICVNTVVQLVLLTSVCDSTEVQLAMFTSVCDSTVVSNVVQLVTLANGYIDIYCGSQ